MICHRISPPQKKEFATVPRRFLQYFVQLHFPFALQSPVGSDNFMVDWVFLTLVKVGR